jgi:hypothetical protein
MFTKNIGAEFNIGYLAGKKSTQHLGPYPPTGTRKINATSLYINPSLVLRAGEGKIIPYGKVGVFLGLVNQVKDFYHMNPYNTIYIATPAITDNRYTYKGGISTGFTSAFGADIMLSDRFAVYGELALRLASYSPKHYKQETITTTSTSSSSGTYEKHIPIDYSSGQLAPIYPLSAIGFNVGVHYYLSKK